MLCNLLDEDIGAQRGCLVNWKSHSLPSIILPKQEYPWALDTILPRTFTLYSVVWSSCAHWASQSHLSLSERHCHLLILESTWWVCMSAGDEPGQDFCVSIWNADFRTLRSNSVLFLGSANEFLSWHCACPPFADGLPRAQGHFHHDHHNTDQPVLSGASLG